MSIQVLKVFEKGFRASITEDLNNSGFIDNYVYQKYKVLPPIFDATRSPLDSLESEFGIVFTDQNFFVDKNIFVRSLGALTPYKVFPFPFTEVEDLIGKAEYPGKEMMAFSHFIYLSLYLQAWAIVKNVKEDSLPSQFKIEKEYPRTLKRLMGTVPTSTTKELDENQVNYLRLNYAFLLTYLVKNL